MIKITNKNVNAFVEFILKSLEKSDYNSSCCSVSDVMNYRQHDEEFGHAVDLIYEAGFDVYNISAFKDFTFDGRYEVVANPKVNINSILFEKELLYENKDYWQQYISDEMCFRKKDNYNVLDIGIARYEVRKYKYPNKIETLPDDETLLKALDIIKKQMLGHTYYGNKQKEIKPTVLAFYDRYQSKERKINCTSYYISFEQKEFQRYSFIIRYGGMGDSLCVFENAGLDYIIPLSDPKENYLSSIIPSISSKEKIEEQRKLFVEHAATFTAFRL